MAYFPNGSSFHDDESRMCSRCIHNGDGDKSPVCAVQELHWRWNYDQCDDATKEQALSALWPQDAGHCRNADCRMFHEGNPEAAANSKRDKRKLKEWERLYGTRK